MNKSLSALAIIFLTATSMATTPKFAPPLQISGLGQSVSAILAKYDFDGDGHKDLLVADHGTGIATIELNKDGTGTNFGSPSMLAFFANSLDGAAAGNLTHSGTTVGALPDLAVASGGSIYIEANQGLVSGTVGFTNTVTLSDPNYYYYNVAVADLDGDGYDDLVVSCQPFNGTAQLAVFMNEGASGFKAPVYYETGAPYVASIAAGDLTGEGRPDVAMAGEMTNPFTGFPTSYVFVFLNQGDGTMGTVTPYQIASSLTSVEIGNVAGHADGRNDVIATGARFYRTSTSPTIFDLPTLDLIINRGDDTFISSSEFPVGLPAALPGNPSRVPPGGAAILNYNSYGTANILVASHGDGGVTQLGFTVAKDSKGLISSIKVASSLVTNYTTAPQSSRVTVADLNGDLRPDIITAVDPAPGGAAADGSTSATVLLNAGTTAPSPLFHVSAVSNAVNGKAPPGTDILYTISYINEGGADALGVTLGSTIPSLATYVNGSASGGGSLLTLHGRSAVKWTFNEVPPGSIGSVSFHVTVNSAAKLGKSLTGVIGVTEGVKLEDSGSLPKVYTENPLQLSLADSCASDSSGVTTIIGDTITYTLNYSNIGLHDALGVVLTSNLPAKTMLSSSSAGAVPSTKGSTQRLQWTLGTLSAGGTGSQAFSVIVSGSNKIGTRITDLGRLDSANYPAVKASFTPSPQVVAQ